MRHDLESGSNRRLRKKRKDEDWEVEVGDS